jgi:nitrile hydratase accessory protein
MADRRPEAVLAWDGPLSPPRRNGELVFDTLWESRIFGLTMTLYEAGRFAWPEFQSRLIETIGEWGRAHGTSGEGFHYWDHWLVAFERLVMAKGLCEPGELTTRVAALAARPPGHDHG